MTNYSSQLSVQVFAFFIVFLLSSTKLCLVAQSLVVQANHPSGIYETSFHLHLVTDDNAATIHYTIDGNIPTQQDLLVQGPILMQSRTGAPNIVSMIPTNNIGPGHPYRENWTAPSGEVFKLNILRARAFLPDGTAGPVFNGTFLIDERGIDRYTLPIVSVVGAQEDLFGFERGIYVPGITGGNYFQRGREWERAVAVCFIGADGQIAFEQDLGVRIHGGTSRNRPRKTLRLYARAEYGKSWIEYPVFPDKAISRHKRLLLRNSGNDWSESLFRDAYLQALAKENTALDLQYSRPCIVFINGEYWGIHNIRDRMDERYLESHYSLDPERVTIMEGNGVFDTGNPEGVDSYHQMVDYITQEDMSLPDRYAQASLLMDIDNFIDYQILQIFSRNTDWPGNNIAFWKHLDGTPQPGISQPGDGRWRWMVFDMDFGFGLNFDYVQNAVSAYGGNNPFHNTLAMAMEPSGPGWPNPPWSTLLMRNLMDNDHFKQRFLTRFSDHLNSTFSPERCNALLDSLIGKYAVEVQEHIHRWTEPSFSYWQQDLERMRTFADLRERFARSHLNTYFGLGGAYRFTADVSEFNAGWIESNSMHLTTNTAGVFAPVYPWEGLYFNRLPLRLVAHAQPGYVFKGWEGDFTDNADTLIVHPTGDMYLKAVFEYTGVHPEDPMNPIAYRLFDGEYSFTEWDSTQPEGEFPISAVFQQSRTSDPGLTAPMMDPYFIPFNSETDNEYHADDQDKIGQVYALTGRTRLEGLGEEGIAFINTGRNRDLGAMVVALDTRGVHHISLDFSAATLDPGSRVYSLALQYRVGIAAEWHDVRQPDGSSVRYRRDSLMGEVTTFEAIQLPEAINDQPYVQLRWKYFYTGERLTQEHGRRDRIRLDDIHIRGEQITSSENRTTSPNTLNFQLSPNPAKEYFDIKLQAPWDGLFSVELFEINGRLIQNWMSQDSLLNESGYRFDMRNDILPGIYLVRVTHQDFSIAKRLIIH